MEITPLSETRVEKFFWLCSSRTANSISTKSSQMTLFCLRSCWRSNPQHFRCQTENFQGCDLPLQKSKRQSDLWEFFAFFPISCLMLLILTHSTPLKREFPHTCKSESKFLNFAVAFTLTNLHLLLQVSKNKQISRWNSLAGGIPPSFRARGEYAGRKLHPDR